MFPLPQNFEVVPYPKEKYGQFHRGDSYIVLYVSIERERERERERLCVT